MLAHVNLFTFANMAPVAGASKQIRPAIHNREKKTDPVGLFYVNVIIPMKNTYSIWFHRLKSIL
jgi:hypothetical protein